MSKGCGPCTLEFHSINGSMHLFYLFIRDQMVGLTEAAALDSIVTLNDRSIANADADDR